MIPVDLSTPPPQNRSQTTVRVFDNKAFARMAKNDKSLKESHPAPGWEAPKVAMPSWAKIVEVALRGAVRLEDRLETSKLVQC